MNRFFFRNETKQHSEYIEAIDNYLGDGTGWFVFANHEQGRKTMPLFASLDAFYPGLLVRSVFYFISFF